MLSSIGQTYEQTKALDGFPYNAVGEEWNVNNVQGKYIILKHEGIGLGVTEQELKEHFKLVEGAQSYDDGVDEEDNEEEECDDEEEVEVEDDSDNKQVGKFKSFLRKMGFK